MGVCRFMTNNFITGSSQIAVTSQRTGLITAPYKEGYGSGGLVPGGAFTGSENVEFLVEIDSTSSGTTMTKATYKWRDSDTAWDSSGLNTTNTTNALSNGVDIRFTTSTGDEFKQGDRWYFNAVAPFGVANLIDGDRNSRWRNASGASTAIMKIDLGSSLLVSVAILHDHNLTSGSTVTLKGGNTTAVAVMTTVMAWSSKSIVHYLSVPTCCRYWQIDITSSATGATCLEASEIYLGDYWQPTNNYEVDERMPIEMVVNTQRAQTGARSDQYFTKKKNFELTFEGVSPTDRDNFEANILNKIGASSSREYKPFFWNQDSADKTLTYLVKLNGQLGQVHHKNWYGISMSLEEAARNV